MSFSRRQILKGALFGGTAAALATAGFGPARLTRSGLLVPNGVAAPKLGTYEMLKDALAQAKRIRLGGTPASAAPNGSIKVVHIKVMNQLHAKLIFRPGTLQADNTVTPIPNERPWTNKAPDCGKALVDVGGIDKVMADPRGAALRLNQWFGGILFQGFEGADTTQVPKAVVSYVGKLPPEVAIQAVLGVDANAAHRPSNMCYPNVGPTLGGDFLYDLHQAGIIAPPLGFTVFNMGGFKETPEGGRLCSVLSSGGDQSVADGQAIDVMTEALQSIVTAGLVDDGLVQAFDKLGATGVPLRGAMLAAKKTLDAQMRLLTQAATSSPTIQKVGLGGSFQQTSHNPELDGPAASEFLAQCRWVVDALNIDPTTYPLSAFCLDLHVADLDGNLFDRGKGPGESRAKGLSYVEGMRQLAFGLNVLAQAVKKHDNLYVLVTAEGGRSESGADDQAPCALILGPSSTQGSTKFMADRLFAHSDFGNSSTAFALSPNTHKMPLDQGGLMSFAQLPDASRAPRISDVLHGLRRHMEGIVTPSIQRSPNYGNYIQVS